jgi:hypothetical protein
MRLFINKATGEVIGTVDGFDDHLTEGVMILPGDLQPDDVEALTIGLGDPNEKMARRLMDAKDELSIDMLRMGPDGLAVKPIAELKALKAAKAQAIKDADAQRRLAASQPDPIKQLQADVEELKKKVK